jgi:membrane protease YdiL (CAAX protease family)/ABC-type Na+ efflux pump permease subunit
MISIKNIKIIFKKEFLQIMRDKSVLFTNFFIPLFGLPLYMIFIIEASTYVVEKKNAPLKDETIFKVSYQGDFEKSLVDNFINDKKINLLKVKSSLKEIEIINYRTNLKEYYRLKGKRKGVKDKINFKKGVLKEQNKKIEEARRKYNNSLSILKKKYKHDYDIHIAIFKNSENVYATYFFHKDSNNISNAARRYSKRLLEVYQKGKVKRLLQQKNVKDYHLQPFSFLEVNIDREASDTIRVVGISIGSGILFLLLISIFNASINTTIGERDQNTYKVLLMNPISLHEIFIGKYLNVSLQGILTLIPYAIEGFIFYAWGSSNHLFEDVSEITSLKLIVLIFCTISTAMLVSSMCFLTSSFAKSRVQAQSLITLLMISVGIPMGIIGVMDIELSLLTAFIPLVNFPMVTESLITASPDYSSIIIALATNMLASMLLIWFSLGAFQIQWKGKSDSKSLSDLLTFSRRKSDCLVPAHSYFAFAIAFIGFIYGGTLVSLLNIDLISFVFSPIMFCLGTSIFIIHYSGLDFTTLFKWRGITFLYSLRMFLAAFILSFLMQLMLENSIVGEVLKSSFPDIFENDLFSSNIGNFLIFAFIPGLTEEILFRGIIFKGLRNQYSFIISMIVSSIFFSLIHFSMFRLGHTFVGGLFLAYIYEKRGLLAAMFFHIIFNSFGLFMEKFSSISKFITHSSSTEKLWIVPIAFIVTAFLIKENSQVSDSSTKNLEATEITIVE